MAVINSFSFALKRLWSHRGIVVCLAAGLIAAIALTVAVPLYADGIQYNLLSASLARSAEQTRRPPFSFIFHYVGAWHGPINPAQYRPLDEFMREQIAGVIRLPLGEVGGVARYVSTDTLQLYPDGRTIRRSERLDLVKVAFVSGVFDNIQLIEGDLPQPSGQEGVLEALVSLSLANELGLKTGQVYRLYRPGEAGGQPFQIRLRVTGVWIPMDASGEFWFYPPTSFDKKLFVSEEAFFNLLAPGLVRPINEAAWRLAFDGGGLNSSEVPRLLARVDNAQTQVAALLPNTDLEYSPAAALRSYRRAAQSLTGLLFVFAAPVLALILYFLGLVAAMLVRRQRSEIAVLRSRGASRGWVVVVYLLEWSLLGAAALLAGPWIGLSIARLIGRTGSFLDFSQSTPLPLRLTPETGAVGLAAAGLAVLFSLLPAWQTGRFTIVSYKQEAARARQRPLWLRAYLDLLLLLPALYGLYTLRVEGRLELFGRALGSADPFQNPLLFLLPTLFIVSLSLLSLRLLPYLLAGLAWLAARLPGAVTVLALRQLSRSASAYLAPLMLLIVTLSLAGFVASMAHTLDRSLHDSVYYEVGADLSLVEGGEAIGEQEGGPPPDPFAAPPGGPLVRTRNEPVTWNFLPASDHLQLPGVQAVARVGRYSAQIRASGRSADGRLVGVDRVDFPGVVFFREDFASEPLVALMNRLASNPAALLVDRRTWERFNLKTGDPVEIAVDLTERQRLPFKVAGFFDYLPSLYPEDGPIFLTNLEYIFESTGGLLPYDVWLRTAPDADSRSIVAGIQRLGAFVVRAQDARELLETSMLSPNRQGTLGLLSVGFLAASALTVIGFMLHAIFSFRERFVQLGVLRALGLSSRQMAAALALEQCLLVLVGLSAGTLIAVLTARLFIPHLPVTFGSHPGTPPYSVQIAWLDMARVYLIFGVMLLLGVAATLGSLSRMNIFQAVKMGENV
jgi:putative ABC transport system permease protein